MKLAFTAQKKCSDALFRSFWRQQKQYDFHDTVPTEWHIDKHYCSNNDKKSTLIMQAILVLGQSVIF